MAIEMVKVRAKIIIGNIIAETPTHAGVSSIIRSFTVNKARGQVSTFNAVLKIPHDAISGNIAGNNVIIYAGENNADIKIFTGMVKQAKISPCWDDPYYVDLNISGVDTLFFLQGKKFTRRCRSTSAAWTSINSVTRKGIKSGKFQYIQDSVIEITPDSPKQEDNVTRPLKQLPVETPPKSGTRVSVLIQPESVSYVA